MDNILKSIYDNKKFERYFEELVEYNQKVNLTAITEKEEVFIKHFYDSLLGAEFIGQNATVVDIGTGAGFPGLALKVYRPDIDLTLVDSLNKRITFLKTMSPILNFEFKTVHSRAEDFANTKYRESFDVAVSRAVASLNTLCEYTLPCVKVGGLFLAYKSLNSQDEIDNAKKAIQILGGKLEFVKNFELPNNCGARTIIGIRKVLTTPLKYPRGKNLPKLKPL